MNFFIIGLPAAGKSRLAKAFSAISQLEYNDLDSIIVEEYGPIANLWHRIGESGFRSIERKCFLAQANSSNMCWALGGGFPCFFDHISRIKSLGLVVHLNTDLELICNRLQSESRPIFGNSKTTPNEVRSLYKKRKSIYAQAHFRIDSQGNLDEDLDQLMHFAKGSP